MFEWRATEPTRKLKHARTLFRRSRREIDGSIGRRSQHHVRARQNEVSARQIGCRPTLTGPVSGRGSGGRALRPRDPAVPDLPQHHRRRRAPRPSRSSASTCRCRSTRCRRDARCSTGRCPTSGTSATPTSPTTPAGASSTSGPTTCTSSTTRCRSTTAVARGAAPAPPLAARSARPRSRTARPTTTRNWGFCLADRQLDAMPDGRLRGVHRHHAAPGSLTYGEFVVPGRTDDEILVSSHVCHPSLCDDNLSGIAVSAALARRLLDGPPPRHTFRFLYAPGTIGAITWLARNRETAERIRHGLTLTCLGDDHPFTYKRTVGGDATDRSGGGPRAGSRLAGQPAHRLLPVRLRRASVQLARVSPARSGR